MQQRPHRMVKKIDREVGVYMLTISRPGDMPIYYVGQSVDIRRRIRHHRKTLRAGKHDNSRMQHAFNKYGADAFSAEVLETCSVDVIDELEQWWLDEMFGHPRVMNLAQNATAPNRGRTFSAEVRARVAEASKGRIVTDDTRALKRVQMKGRKLSAETKQKIVNTKRERSHLYMPRTGSLHHRSKPVIGVNLLTGERVFLDSAGRGRELGFDPGGIGKVCRGIWPRYKGYVWHYANGVDNKLLDGYDGGDAPPPEFIQQLMASAPPEIRARAEAFARERARQQEPAPEGAQ